MLVDILFNVNQNQWYLSSNDASCHLNCFNNTQREKLCFTQSSTTTY